MTGAIHVRGQEALYYRRKPKGQEQWPPRFMKFILYFEPQEPNSAPVEIAFVDARRLGRIRLCKEPLKEPPISNLGFDPILSMPSLEDFEAKVLKRGCPIKALLLDQSFSAGVGNWIADEVLFHSAIHPEQTCKSLTSGQIQSLHHNIVYVCQTAVDVNADSSQFPPHWLFQHRWETPSDDSSSSSESTDDLSDVHSDSGSAKKPPAKRKRSEKKPKPARKKLKRSGLTQLAEELTLTK
ncbi:hypothetical protein FRC15_002670 [Serendipita sp. 397]|nr:hypothetical protein FRC15_002670 [Serendipita sp. 397]KAG8799888.1 hypothetical protein FRC16_004198 [Serendipita sp. 398]